MQKKLEIIRIINNMMLVYMIAGVLFICAGMEPDSALFAGNLLLVVFVAISEAVQYLCPKLVMFLAGHIFGIAFCTFLSVVSGTQHLGFTIVRVFFMIVMTIIAINIKLGNGVYFYPTIPEAFAFVSLMIPCKLAKAGKAELLVLLCEMLWGVLAVLFYNTRQTASAMSVFKERARVPYDSILRTNRLMLGVYLGITFVFMFICTLLDYGKQIMDVVGGALVRFLRWLFSHFNYFIDDEEYMPSAPEQQMGQNFVPMGEDDSLLRIFWDVLFWTVTVVVSIGFIYLIFRAIQLFIKYFNERQIGIRDRLSRDKVEYLNPVFDEKRPGREGKKNRIPLANRLTARGQIRLLYKRFVKAGAGFDNVKNSDTPEEQLWAARGEEALGGGIRELYEKARYSSAEVSAEDVKNMRKMSR